MENIVGLKNIHAYNDLLEDI